MNMLNNSIESNGKAYTMSMDDDDERDSVDDPKSARAAMHNSILEPIEMPAWVGGRRKESFASVDYSDSGTSDFWNHRGTYVDPSTLKFASNEPPEEAQTGGFRLPLFPNKNNDEESSDDEYNHAHVMKQKSEKDWNAFIKDVTVAPSKLEGQGLDFFFGIMNRRNQSIQKDLQSESTNKQEKGLLGAMLDRASNPSLPATGASAPVAAGSITSKSDRSASIVSDGFPSFTNKATEDSTRSIPVASSLTKNENDDCSNGSIGSSASWDPCQDIWDEDMNITSKRVEAERRVATKRTGKELWQIVRDNRRVIIGKSLRIQDIIMMSKRPWRKQAQPVISEHSTNETIEAEPKKVEPVDAALNMEDELALVSLAPETILSTKKSQKTSKDKDRKKKYRSKSRDGESTTKESTSRSRRSSKSSKVSKPSSTGNDTSISTKSESKDRSKSSRRHTIAGEELKSRKEGTSRSRSSSRHSRKQDSKLPSSKQSITRGTSSSRSSSRHSRKQDKKLPSSKQSITSSAATTITTTASMMSLDNNSKNNHCRKTQRGQTNRVIMEASVSSYEHSGGVSQEDKEEELKAASLEDQKLGNSKVSQNEEISKAERQPKSSSDHARKTLFKFLQEDKAAVEEEKKKRKKKSRKSSSRDVEEKSKRRHSTKTASSSSKERQKSSSPSSHKNQASRKPRRTTVPE
jgi:hypothetical protein